MKLIILITGFFILPLAQAQRDCLKELVGTYSNQILNARSESRTMSITFSPDEGKKYATLDMACDGKATPGQYQVVDRGSCQLELVEIEAGSSQCSLGLRPRLSLYKFTGQGKLVIRTRLLAPGFNGVYEFFFQAQ